MGASHHSRRAVLCLAVAIAAGVTACATASHPRGDEVTLSLTEFFVRPVGPRGQEPTPTLLGLNGKRVVVRGFMVREEEPFPGFFMLADLPVTIAERADGPSDYLPPATLYVHLPEAQRHEIANYMPAALELTGTLELGAVEEGSGRVSYVRLRLDDLNDARTAEVEARPNP